MNSLKDQRQVFGFSKREYVNDATSMLQVIVTNKGLQEGYYIKEIGVFAQDPDEGEILYSLSLAADGKWDYLPEYEWGAAMIELEIDTAVSNAEKVVITAKMDALATADDVNALREPEFEDYSEQEEVPEAGEAVHMIKSGKQLPELLQYIKASLTGLLELGNKLEDEKVDKESYNQELLKIMYPEFEDYAAGAVPPTTEDAVAGIVAGKSVCLLLQYMKAALMGLQSENRELSREMDRHSPFVTMFRNIPVSERTEDKWYLLVTDAKGVTAYCCSQYVLMDGDVPLEEREEFVLYGSETEVKSSLEPFEKPAIMRILSFESLKSREIPEGSIREQDIFYFYETEEKKVWQE